MDAPPRQGSSLYHAIRCTPRLQRTPLKLWMRWWHEVSCIPMEVSDPGVAEQKLQWWLQEVRSALAGNPQHPLMLEYGAMQPLQPPCAWPETALWTQQLDGLIQLVNQTRWLDDTALQRHNRLTTGSAAEGAACILGATSLPARSAACTLGVGIRQSHQLTRLGLDARKGWVNVAIDVLQTHDVKAHELSKPDLNKIPAGWPALLSHLAGQARATLEQGLEATEKLTPREFEALLPLRILAHIHLAQLDAILMMGHRILSERVVLTPLRKWWISQRIIWKKPRPSQSQML